MSILDKLTEGMVPRDLHAESHALVEKWERTGLLEGLGTDEIKNQMSQLLENQAKELLRESSTMAGGDVEGFAAVAFPLVRRVFGSLVAQDLVSVQPMSLPSGLIFFLDFTTSTGGAGLPRLGWPSSEQSLYGGGRIASQITGGVILGGTGNNFYQTEVGPYSLNNGYASPTGTVILATTMVSSGTIALGGIPDTTTVGGGTVAAYSNYITRLLQFDPDLISGSAYAICSVTKAGLESGGVNFDFDNMIAITITGGLGADTAQVRRLTVEDPSSDANVLLVVTDTTGSAVDANIVDVAAALDAIVAVDIPLADNFNAGAPVGSVVGATTWGLEGDPNIPEIDIKVDSVSVTAMTKKLKAKWTPELGQDLNAYHNLDAEVELTSILSEQIALEIDNEILEDLVKGAEADTLYWSRRPGRFLVRDTGADISTAANESILGGDFTGTVSEWYETLLETINDVSAQIHRKTLRGGANFVVVSPEMANLLEFTAGFRASVTHDDDRGTIGAVKVGSLSKKFDVFVDPYFLRNVCLVGRRGASFLESGYVYAPYVPLQVTPTIFGVEDFVPRKGVMTRYAKKMVRPDMYGLVIVKDFLG
jgi:hypothetical protein